MDHTPRIGLSAREIKKRWDWIMKYPPKDPAQLQERLGEAVAQLIAENNAAIERELTARGLLRSED
jgi:hypothetical protein